MSGPLLGRLGALWFDSCKRPLSLCISGGRLRKVRLILGKFSIIIITITRVAEFDFLAENLDSGAVKLVLTQFDSRLSAIFITFCPNCDISM